MATRTNPAKMKKLPDHSGTALDQSIEGLHQDDLIAIADAAQLDTPGVQRRANR